MEASTALHPASTRIGTISTRWSALGALLFGLVLLYTVAFSTLPRAHSAAHDARHANGFPCH